MKGGWMESQEALAQQGKVKGNEELGGHRCQTLVGEDWSQQLFLQAP